MNLVRELLKFIHRIKHPVSQPEDIGKDLGVQILYNELDFDECVQMLTNPEHSPRNLIKYMPREDAEALFKSAIRKEKFKNSSLFSYYIYDGWFAFALTFDIQNRLRRLYIQHKDLKKDGDSGLEICLHCQLKQETTLQL